MTTGRCIANCTREALDTAAVCEFHLSNPSHLPPIVTKTVWGLYHINRARTEGHSDFFETYEDALNAMIYTPSEGTPYILKQTYEVEEDGSHGCGDDE